MECEMMKKISKILYAIWMITAYALCLFFLISPNACGAYLSGAALVVYGVFSFLIKCLEDKYNPERSVSKISKISTGILIVLIIIRCVLIT